MKRLLTATEEQKIHSEFTLYNWRHSTYNINFGGVNHFLRSIINATESVGKLKNKSFAVKKYQWTDLLIKVTVVSLNEDE